MDPRDLILISPAQFARRAWWNDRVRPEHQWPLPFDPSLEIEWVTGHDCATGREILLPAAHVYLGYEDALVSGFPVPDSSGLAAGHARENAAERGILEVVERDAVAIWWYNRIAKPALQFDGAFADLINEYKAWAAARDRRFWIIDLTTDLLVPVAAAIACDSDHRRFSLGFGAGWTSEAAAFSAMGELVQFEATRAQRTDNSVKDPYNVLHVLEEPSEDMLRYLLPVSLQQAAAPADKAVDFDGLIQTLSERNQRPALFTFMEDDMAVVRIVVPGLRPIWPRFAKGRLYDVPVVMQDMPAPSREGDLNPHPLLY